MTDPLAGDNPERSSWDEDPEMHAHRTYIRFLRGVFASLAGGPRDEWLWHADNKQSRITIQWKIGLDAEVVAAKPAIIVTSQGISAPSQVIGDFDHLNPFTGGLTLIEEIRGMLAVYVLSSNEIEARRIAWYVKDTTWALQRTLTSNEGFHYIGRGIRVGEAMAPGSLVAEGNVRDSLHAVPLVVPYAVHRRVRVTPVNAPQLTQINIFRTAVNPSGPVDEQLPSGWSVDTWLAARHRATGYRMPTDPARLTPALPTGAGPGRQSEGEVLIEVDLPE